MELCYLGAINNVIDIPSICNLLQNLIIKKPVTLHIIGKGERERELVESAKATGAKVVFYGPVYDDAKKLEIMSKCHFGLNVMKSSVCVGLTMKSVEYFRFGIPIINNIPYDTMRLVEERHVGVQLDSKCFDFLNELSINDCVVMRENVQEMVSQLFCEKVIFDEYQAVLNNVIVL